MILNKKDESITLSNNEFEVQIQKKIFGGYTFKKFIKNSPFDLLESRDVRLNLSEDEAIELGKELLNKVYKTKNLFKRINYIIT
ncbi:MAG: hypothetical protein ACOWWH_10445 [Eubacteriaceae bacterium]